MRNRLLCLLAASLTLCACEHLPKQPPQWTPLQLDSKLAEPCHKNGLPASDDYDAWQAWVQDKVLPNYADCAIRHNATVDAWPK